MSEVDQNLLDFNIWFLILGLSGKEQLVLLNYAAVSPNLSSYPVGTALLHFLPEFYQNHTVFHIYYYT